MVASTLFPATRSQLCSSSKSGLFSPCQGLMLKSNKTQLSMTEKNTRITCQATSIPADDPVPDMEKRKLMNLLLLCAISLPTGFMVVPYASFSVPAGTGGDGDGTIAKDAFGNDVLASQWLKSHGPGDRTLTQGLKVLALPEIFRKIGFSTKEKTKREPWSHMLHYCTSVEPAI